MFALSKNEYNQLKYFYIPLLLCEDYTILYKSTNYIVVNTSKTKILVLILGTTIFHIKSEISFWFWWWEPPTAVIHICIDFWSESAFENSSWVSKLLTANWQLIKLNFTEKIFEIVVDFRGSYHIMWCCAEEMSTTAEQSWLQNCG